VSVDDSLLVGHFSGIGKYECQIECSHLGDACWGVAFLEGPATQCKLLSEAPSVQPAQNACRQGSWNWELSEKQPRAVGGLVGTIGGLETAYPGQTALQTFSYCEDGFMVSIFWRLLSYQFTHVGLAHVGSNCLFLFFLAVPLEGFHGTGLTALMYTMGVVGGGLTWTLLNPYKVAQGASGGVYALLGMHLADLILNWKQKKFRYAELLLLACMTVLEEVCYISSVQDGMSRTAHSVHAGGLVSGLIVGIVLTRNINVKRWERGLQALALLAGAGLVCFCLAWWFSSPFPGIRSLLSGGEGPLCWIGQVCTNADNTGCDYNIGWQCVACSTRECVENWYKDELSFCVKRGGHQTCDGNFVDIVHNCQNC
jgi:membrane associated rhomboid family serine protease